MAGRILANDHGIVIIGLLAFHNFAMSFDHHSAVNLKYHCSVLVFGFFLVVGFECFVLFSRVLSNRISCLLVGLILGR